MQKFNWGNLEALSSIYISDKFIFQFENVHSPPPDTHVFHLLLHSTEWSMSSLTLEGCLHIHLQTSQSNRFVQNRISTSLEASYGPKLILDDQSDVEPRSLQCTNTEDGLLSETGDILCPQFNF